MNIHAHIAFLANFQITKYQNGCHFIGIKIGILESIIFNLNQKSINNQNGKITYNLLLNQAIWTGANSIHTCTNMSAVKDRCEHSSTHNFSCHFSNHKISIHISMVIMIVLLFALKKLLYFVFFWIEMFVVEILHRLIRLNSVFTLNKIKKSNSFKYIFHSLFKTKINGKLYFYFPFNSFTFSFSD